MVIKSSYQVNCTIRITRLPPRSILKAICSIPDEGGWLQIDQTKWEAGVTSYQNPSYLLYWARHCTWTRALSWMLLVTHLWDEHLRNSSHSFHLWTSVIANNYFSIISSKLIKQILPKRKTINMNICCLLHKGHKGDTKMKKYQVGLLWQMEHSISWE